MAKRITALFFAVVMIMSLCVTPNAKSEKVTNVNEAMKFARSCNPFEIKKATLYTEGKKVGTVYVVGMTGTNNSLDTDDILCFQNCLRAGFNIDNSYKAEVKEAMFRQIPKDADVIFICHSLGGMVAQQLAADEEVKENFNILNTLAIGSPYVVQFSEKEGELHRMADSGDAIPYMSPAGVANFFLGNFTYEDCGYFGNPDGAHNESYAKAENWNKYDCFGIENGTNYIVIK